MQENPPTSGGKVVVISYLGFALAWIVASDALVASVAPDLRSMGAFQTAKGIAFVLLSALLLYWLIRRAERRDAAAASDLARGQTELSDAARQLQRLGTQLGLAEGHGRIGFFQYDLVTDSVEFSDKALEIYGLPRDAWHDVVSRWLGLVHPDDRARMGNEFENGLRAGGQFDLEFKIVRPDGEQRDLFVVVAVEQDASGRPLRTSGTVMDVTERERARRALEESAVRLRRLSLRLVRVQERERRRLARELHDGVGQMLTAAKLRAQASLGRAPELAALIADLDSLLQQIRTLSLNLRPSMLDDLGLPATLRWYLNQQRELGGFEVELSLQGLEQRPDPEIETAAFRIVQEAMTNVLRHAAAKKVRVKAWCRSSEFELEISDDGRGFDAAAQPNHGGLLGMRERAGLLGGSWVIHSAPGAGTVVRASLPLTTTIEPDDAVS